MKNSAFPLFCLAFLAAACAASPGFAADRPPKEGEALAPFTLPAPEIPVYCRYLRIPGGKTFRTDAVAARVLIIEIFSMYCPYCQREAPAINRLYQRIEKDTRFRGEIKLIGIGAGNSAFEVEIFRKKYRVPFPLLPDPEFFIHARMAKVRTPYFIAATINPAGPHTVLYSRLGGIGSPEGFLKLIVERAGLGRKEQ